MADLTIKEIVSAWVKHPHIQSGTVVMYVKKNDTRAIRKAHSVHHLADYSFKISELKKDIEIWKDRDNLFVRNPFFTSQDFLHEISTFKFTRTVISEAGLTVIIVYDEFDILIEHKINRILEQHSKGFYRK